MTTCLPLPALLLRISIPFLIFLLSVLTNSANAMDKRTFVHIVPPGINAFHLVFVDTNSASSQYRPNGQLQTKVNNDALMAKSIARFSVSENLELAIEIPYFLERKQQRTSASGGTQYRFDSQGIGDASMQLTKQWRDSRKGGLGFLTGVELKFPTGDKDNGLGSQTWDGSLRTVLSYKTPWGFPYGMAIYTDTGSTLQNNIRVDPADDLYLSAGFKSRFWHGFGFDLTAYRYISTSRATTENNGSPVITEQHDTPGWKIYGRYRFSKSLEWNIIYERGYPEDHAAYINGTVISKRPDGKERFGTIIKYFW